MRKIEDLLKTKIWLFDEPYYVDDEQLKVINTKGVRDDHALDFVKTGKKSDHIKSCIERAAKEAAATPAQVKNVVTEAQLDAAIEKAMANLLASYDLVKKK